MKKHSSFCLSVIGAVLAISMFYPLQAQEMGNQGYANYSELNKMYSNASSYGNNTYQTMQSGSRIKPSVVIEGDSILYINSRVLMNKRADKHLVVVAVHQEAKNVQACNQEINKRINLFLKDLEDSLAVGKEQVFIDLIRFNPVYDYTVHGKNSTQYLEGYEMLKNVIIPLKDPELLEPLLILASRQDIFDFVKMDHIVADPEEIYQEMYSQAISIIEKKRKQYLQNSSRLLLDKSIVSLDNFYHIEPDDLYKSYTAYESSSVYRNYYNSGIQKDMRKSKTSYYDRLNYAHFDRVINSSDPVVSNQFIMEVQIKYFIEMDPAYPLVPIVD